MVTLTAALSILLTTSLSAEASNGCGGASWYGAGGRTASGEKMVTGTLTAAHRSFRFGTRLKVTNANNGRSVVVRINDRGPFVRGRVLDLSKAAAQNIGMIHSGTARVCYEIIG